MIYMMKKSDDYNKLTKDILDEKIKKEKLINESSLKEKIKTLAAKEKISRSNKSRIISRAR